ncbi:MAG: AAA family ATPase [Lutibacter sp.]
MIPENITKEHIEKAIKEIEEKGIRKGRHSSKYDIEFNGNLYPPKLVISIANRFANGEELDPYSFYGGKGTPALELLKKEGFSIVQKNDPLLDLIENYKVHISTNKLEDEVYKWKLVTEYKNRPNTDAPDFYKEINSIKFQNLVYAMGIAVIKQLAKEKPEELRELFKYLFDESKELKDRIKYFNKETLRIYRALGETLQHHQDERSIATYLTIHNPEKYTFYKSSFYTKFCKLYGIKVAKKNEKYPHYLELLNQFIEDYIKPDDELIGLIKKLIPAYYDGTNNLLLAQDILFQMLNKNEDEVNYWIFQGNPKIYNVVDAINDNALKSWTVKTHKDKIKKGDKIVFWLTGDISGCYALGETTSEVYEGADDEAELKYYYIDIDPNEKSLRIDVKITHNLTSTPITKELINDIEELKDLKVGNQGTNFSATKEEYDKILDIVNSNNDDAYELVKKELDPIKLNSFLSLLRQFVNNQNLDPFDDRISFNVRPKDKYLAFLIGNRYGFLIGKKKKKTDFRFISSEKLSADSGEFMNHNKGVEAYWNYVDEIQAYKDEIYNGLLRELERLNKCPFRKFTNQDFINDVYQKEMNALTQNQNNMNFPLNTILYGPPGTGKTYNTILKAAEIIEDRIITDYEEAKRIFNNHLGNRIEFITFHQNYSYEDFIQGLRPETENNADLTFNKVDGVFKRISDRAFNNLRLAEKAPEEVSKELLFEQAIESFTEEVESKEDIYKLNENVAIINVDKDAFRYTGENWKQSSTGGLRMKFDDLREFYNNGVSNRKDIKNLKTISGLANQHATYYLLVYNKILQYLPKEIKVLQAPIQKDNYVIIIDEINRANISRVFGELITLIEPDKRSHGAIPLKCTLPSGDEFMVPSNLYIIGTMNTADKSIALLDIALRRRFEFEAMYPLYTIKDHEVHDREVLEKINKEIINKKGYDFQIGHAYFMGNNNDIVNRMNKKVIPLLMEYFMNDEKEVRNILTNAGLEIQENSWPLRILGINGKV